MANADDKIIVQIQLDDGSIKQGFINIQKGSKETSDKMKKDFDGSTVNGLTASLGKAGKALLAIGAAIGGLVALKRGLNAVVSEAVASENAVNRFNNALGRTGQFSKEFSADFQGYVDQLQNSSKFADDAILSNAALLQTIGRLSQSQLKPATQAAVDLASAYGIGLEQAFETVGKAANGQTVALNKMGIEVKKGATDAETFANALALINSRVGGAAASEINTYAGAIARTGNAFDNLLESIGLLITKNPQIIKIINLIGETFNQITSQIAGNKGLSQGVTNFIMKLVDVAEAVNFYLIRPLVRLSEIGKFVFAAIVNGVQLLIVSFADTGVAIGKILNLVGIVSDQGLENIRTFASSSRDTLAQFSQDVRDSFQSIGDSDFADRLGAKIQNLRTELANAKPVSEEVKNSVVSNFAQMSEAAEQAQQRINAAIQTGVVNTIVASVSRMGAALHQGGKAFSGFAKQVLSIIGDMAIQIGSTLIAIGLGIDALKVSLGTLTGGLAIAAGFALVALGGLLKSLGGGDLGATSGAGGGTFGGSPSTAPSPELQANPLQGPQTQNTVIIQGDVFDSDGTGQRMVQILREFGDKNGQVTFA